MQTGRWDRDAESLASEASVYSAWRTVPGHAATALTATAQRAEPHVLDGATELLQACVVARNSIVLTPAPIHALQPAARRLQVVMAAAAQFVPHVREFRLELSSRRPSMDGEVASPSLPTDMGKTQKVEGLGWPLTGCGASFLRVAPELDQPCFLRMQGQAELGNPFSESGQTVAGVRFLTESDHEVVRVAHNHDFPWRVYK
jgi:hypothetical protein